MVFGIETFTLHFKGYEDNYVLIGGTACELALGELGQTFRATKDLDIVLDRGRFRCHLVVPGGTGQSRRVEGIARRLCTGYLC